MYEIELKAHVKDRSSTIRNINTFATYLGTTIKEDTYFHLQTDSSTPQNHITCRLRHEDYTFPDSSTKSLDLLTYKKKSLRKNPDGTTYEVNEENESELSNPDTIVKLITDSGFTEAYTKHKDVMQWTFSTGYGDAHLELCTIPPLGDFLEIEIVSENCHNDSLIQAELQSLIVRAGVQLSEIEPKYYSQLLAEARKN